jgi:hypothetical protein
MIWLLLKPYVLHTRSDACCGDGDGMGHGTGDGNGRGWLYGYGSGVETGDPLTRGEVVRYGDGCSYGTGDGNGLGGRARGVRWV